MKILFVEYFGRGGIAHYTHCLAQALAKLGIDIILCTDSAYEFGQMELPYQFHQTFRIYGPAGQSGNHCRSKLTKGIGYLQGLWRLCGAVKGIGPDVVHVQSSSLLPLAELGILTWLRGHVPLVYTVHNLLPHEARLHHRFTYKGIYRLPQALIVHGKAIKADLLHQFARSSGIYVIPLGEYSFLFPERNAPSQSVARRWWGLAEEVPLVLFFGSIRAYKGLDTLLRALPEVLAAIPSARLGIVGSPLESFDGYQAQINGLGLSEHIRTVLDYVPQEHIPFYFAAADVVALPYKHTYQSAVVQLAYAAARPVVVTRTGALPEVVVDGQSGLLIPPEDPHALAEAIVHLLRDPYTARRMGEYGRHLAKTRFSWDAIAKQTVTVYEYLLGES